ncbi:hypothetical protein BSKO_02198 [Bryopsis sp. KO-2023]|nr:hypothetical protein BSKO_02198 [Bryopsis sp. KO-2023]
MTPQVREAANWLSGNAALVLIPLVLPNASFFNRYESAERTMKGFFNLVGAPQASIDLVFRGKGDHPLRKAKVPNKADDANPIEELPLYSTGGSVHGDVRVAPVPGKKFEHNGIRVQLIGQIELASERGNYYDFLSLTRELSPPGDLTTIENHAFEFLNVEMQYDSYRGKLARCRYMLRVTVVGRGMTPSAVKDYHFWVRNYENPQDEEKLIKMEVGIEECLHIEFEYGKDFFHLNDVVVGKIYFLLVRIKLKYMEIELRRKETTRLGANPRNETETIGKYEIMDGAPVRGETVPIRMYLTPYHLTPTYENVHNKFSVKYMLNLVLVDDEDRRYFKQQEIRLYRKPEPTAK